MTTLRVLLLFFMIISLTIAGYLFASEQKEKSSLVPVGNEVLIAGTAIEMPLERILLVRKSSEYCAIKFNKFWIGSTEEDYFATYESYYQSDKTGDFMKKNVQYKTDELSYPKPRGIGRFSFTFGNKEVQCGSISLFWTRRGIVCFFSKGQRPDDYGIELAPTIWTDISQVNVFDKRIRWFKYDASRTRQTIPIERLWEKNKDN